MISPRACVKALKERNEEISLVSEYQCHMYSLGPPFDTTTSPSLMMKKCEARSPDYFALLILARCCCMMFFQEHA